MTFWRNRITTAARFDRTWSPDFHPHVGNCRAAREMVRQSAAVLTDIPVPLCSRRRL
jgi:hypothetical protein